VKVDDVDEGAGETVGPGDQIVYTLTLTNTVTGSTQLVGYTFNEVVPANTTLVSVGGAGTSTCIAGAVAGTLCPIVVNSTIAGTPVTVTFTVQVNATLPAGTGNIFNQVYYVTPPASCVAGSTSPSCDPPVCTPAGSSTCDAPTTCQAGDLTCEATPVDGAVPSVYITKQDDGSVDALAANVVIPYTITRTTAEPATTHPAGYPVPVPIPANTTLVSVGGAGSVDTAATPACSVNAGGGTRCDIVVNSAIAFGAPVSVTFTVRVNAVLPPNTNYIVNQAYYLTPPAVCEPTGTPICNPQPPSCTGATCAPPTACVVLDDPACVITPPQADMVADVPQQIPRSDTAITVPTRCYNDGPSEAEEAYCTVAVTVSAGTAPTASTVCTYDGQEITQANRVAFLPVGDEIVCQTTFTPPTDPGVVVTVTTTAFSSTPDPDMRNNLDRPVDTRVAGDVVAVPDDTGWMLALLTLLLAVGTAARMRRKG
jgi:uncharacterized repeat protein (TIGR01451 family)